MGFTCNFIPGDLKVLFCYFGYYAAGAVAGSQLCCAVDLQYHVTREGLGESSTPSAITAVPFSFRLACLEGRGEDAAWTAKSPR